MPLGHPNVGDCSHKGHIVQCLQGTAGFHPTVGQVVQPHLLCSEITPMHLAIDRTVPIAMNAPFVQKPIQFLAVQNTSLASSIRHLEVDIPPSLWGRGPTPLKLKPLEIWL